MSLDVFLFIHQVGLPIASSVLAGYFVFLTLKFILASVTSSVRSMATIVKSLHSRVSTMTTELQRIDVVVTQALGMRVDVDRLARSRREDERKD